MRGIFFSSLLSQLSSSDFCKPKARRSQKNNAQLYLAEPYSVHYKVAYDINNADLDLDLEH